MNLAPDSRLGPYEIAAQIGQVGMGEVYKAKDTPLNRIVAVKVIPRHLRDNPELRERFEREAQAVAALNHAHIRFLHDIGHDSGTDFLVMEYLEGQTLVERLEKGAFTARPGPSVRHPDRRCPRQGASQKGSSAVSNTCASYGWQANANHFFFGLNASLTCFSILL
jgi:serine/threonine protein kinase